MAKPEQPSRDSQMRKFQEAARELGCDDSEEAFDAALRKVVTAKSKEPPPEMQDNRITVEQFGAVSDQQAIKQRKGHSGERPSASRKNDSSS